MKDRGIQQDTVASHSVEIQDHHVEGELAPVVSGKKKKISAHQPRQYHGTGSVVRFVRTHELL